MIDSITISDRYINEILVEVGYPVITFEELELTKNQIKDLVVIPVIREYYSWFPLTSTSEYSASSTFSIDFPDDDTFGVLDARINTNSLGGGSVTSNPFINEQFVWNTHRTRRYGTKNDYDLDIASTYTRMQREAELNSIVGKKIDVSIKNRTVTGYTNVVGKLVITWAKYSELFSDIPHFKIDEVLKLCKARLLRTLAMIRGQAATDTPMEFDYQMFLERAETLEEQVKEKWQNYTKPVIRRA